MIHLRVIFGGFELNSTKKAILTGMGLYTTRESMYIFHLKLGLWRMELTTVLLI